MKDFLKESALLGLGKFYSEVKMCICYSPLLGYCTNVLKFSIALKQLIEESMLCLDTDTDRDLPSKK